MNIFVINLARRSDRMEIMARQLNAMGLRYERLDAVDAESVSGEVVASYWPADTRLRDPVTLGAKCCFISHRKAWERFLSTGDPWGAFLEDDCRLHPDSQRFLADDKWLPEEASVVKLEVNFTRRNTKIVVGKARSVGHGYELACLWSKHMGAAAYMLSRAGAKTLMECTNRPALEVDAILFDPNVSAVFRKLAPLQLCPAVAAQSVETGASDLQQWRTQQRNASKPGIQRKLRNLRRSYEEARNLPKLAIMLMLGKARLVEIGFGQTENMEPATGKIDWALRSPYL